MTAPDPAVERGPAIERARMFLWLALLVVAGLDDDDALQLVPESYLP